MIIRESLQFLIEDHACDITMCQGHCICYTCCRHTSCVLTLASCLPRALAYLRTSLLFLLIHTCTCTYTSDFKTLVMNGFFFFLTEGITQNRGQHDTLFHTTKFKLSPPLSMSVFSSNFLHTLSLLLHLSSCPSPCSL